MASELHVVSKKDLSKHTTLSVQLPAPGPLPASTIRVRSKVLGFTANNFTYALYGEWLHWWDAWPVPAAAGEPYNDSAAWGIVPAWGFAEVDESAVDGIAKGAWLWGFWPISSHQVELTLEPIVGSEGHFMEVSEARKQVMPFYQAYSLVGPTPPSEDTLGWMASNFAVWSAGLLLSRHVFAEDPSKGAVHPRAGSPWTSEDADLSSAVVVSLSATSKTGLSTAWNLAQRAPGSGPLAFLQATGSPDAVPSISSDRLKNKVVSYADLMTQDVAEWVAAQKPSRVVVLDFGGPRGLASQFGEFAFAKLPADTSFTLIPIGAPPTLPPSQAPPAAAGADPKFAFQQSLMLNAGGVHSIVAAREGFKSIWDERLRVFKQWIADKGMGDTQLLWGQGINGDEGMHKAWDDLCKGEMPRHKAMVFKLNS